MITDSPFNNTGKVRQDQQYKFMIVLAVLLHNAKVSDKVEHGMW